MSAKTQIENPPDSIFLHKIHNPFSFISSKAHIMGRLGRLKCLILNITSHFLDAPKLCILLAQFFRYIIPTLWEIEAEGWQVQILPRQFVEILSQTKRKGTGELAQGRAPLALLSSIKMKLHVLLF